MRIVLVTGAAGQLGRALAAQVWPREFGARYAARKNLDITNYEEVEAAIADPAVSCVVNAAAYTAVDRAEREGGLARAINTTGPGLLAHQCARRGVPLVHISTDYVFDGGKGSPYLETDPVGPLNLYGKSKADGEGAVRGCHARHVIIRTCGIFSSSDDNFVKTMVRLGRERASLPVVDDQTCCPTAADDLAAAIIEIVGRILSPSGHDREDLFGTFHFCGRPATSWHHFAQQIFSHVRAAGRAVPQLVAIPSAEYPAPAMRPKYSALDCSKVYSLFGLTAPPWGGRLESVVADLLKAPENMLT